MTAVLKRLFNLGTLIGLAFGFLGYIADSLWMPNARSPVIYVVVNVLTGCVIGILYHHVCNLSVIDNLTQVYNRGYLVDQLRRHINLCERHTYPVSLAIMDLDYFKRYNDTQGHLEGDKLLQAVAAVLKEQARPSDIVARYGGDEFVLILPHTDGDGASRLIGRVRESLMLTALRGTGVTLSVGIATAPADGRSVEALMGAADKALYQAKICRDQIVRYRYGARQPNHTPVV